MGKREVGAEYVDTIRPLHIPGCNGLQAEFLQSHRAPQQLLVCANLLYTKFLLRWREESVGGEKEEYTLQNINHSQMFSLLLDTASSHMVSGQPPTTTISTTIDCSLVSLTNLPPILEAGTPPFQCAELENGKN